MERATNLKPRPDNSSSPCANGGVGGPSLWPEYGYAASHSPGRDPARRNPGGHAPTGENTRGRPHGGKPGANRPVAHGSAPSGKRSHAPSGCTAH